MKYLLQKSDTKPLWWVLTDTENQIVCRFKEGHFNDTQQLTPLKDASNYDISALPSIVAAMADWLRENHYDIIFDSPQLSEIRRNLRKDIGSALKKARLERDISLTSLSELTGVDKNHICRIEGGRLNVDIDTIAILAHFLGISITLDN